MSSNITNFYGKQYDHLGEVRRGLPRDHAVVVQCTRSSNINSSIALFPGLCVYPVGANSISPGMPNQFPRYTVEPGVGVGKGLPIYLLSGQADFDVSISNLPTGVSYPGNSSYPLPAISSQPGYQGSTIQVQIGIIVNQGFEFETTEFDTAQTYTAGQPLRAVLSNTDANAGKFTNQGNTGSGSPGFTISQAMVVGTDTIAGFVGAGSYPNSWQRPVLSILAWYMAGSR